MLTLIQRSRDTSVGRTAALTVTLGVLGGLCLLTAPAANATTVAAGVNLRPCVDLSNGNCAPVGTTGNAGVTRMRCYRDGAWATGNYRSNRWFLLLLTDGREGYVHSSFVGNQVLTPNCSTLPYVRAADFAISQIGNLYAPSNLAGNYTDWSPGPFAEWSGDCAKLTHMSFYYGANTSYARGNAIDQYHFYKNSGIVYGGLPRYGDPVFYNIAAPYGHTAIYIGGTTIVSTQGMDGDHRPVARRDINSFGNYLGWARV
jgi:hypothetical protein